MSKNSRASGHRRALQHQAFQWWHPSARPCKVSGIRCRVGSYLWGYQEERHGGVTFCDNVDGIAVKITNNDKNPWGGFASRMQAVFFVGHDFWVLDVGEPHSLSALGRLSSRVGHKCTATEWQWYRNSKVIDSPLARPPWSITKMRNWCWRLVRKWEVAGPK